MNQARAFEREERVGFSNVECELSLLDADLHESPLGRQSSRFTWDTTWSVQVLEPRTFELSGTGFEAHYVGIYVGGSVMFVLPIITGPVYTGNLTVG